MSLFIRGDGGYFPSTEGLCHLDGLILEAVFFFVSCDSSHISIALILICIEMYVKWKITFIGVHKWLYLVLVEYVLAIRSSLKPVILIRRNRTISLDP